MKQPSNFATENTEITEIFFDFQNRCEDLQEMQPAQTLVRLNEFIDWEIFRPQLAGDLVIHTIGSGKGIRREWEPKPVEPTGKGSIQAFSSRRSIEKITIREQKARLRHPGKQNSVANFKIARRLNEVVLKSCC